MKDELKPIQNLRKSINNFLIKNTEAVATRLDNIEGPWYHMCEPAPPLNCGRYRVTGVLIFEKKDCPIFSIDFRIEIMHGDLEN